jgi:lipopolysaccharide export system protein LptA
MPRSPDVLVAVLLAVAWPALAQPVGTVPAETKPAADAPADGAKPGADAKPADAKPGTTGTFLGFGGTRSKEPITITSDSLEYEYKDGIVVYRGDVIAIQGEVKVRSNELRITLVRTDEKKPAAGAASEIGSADTSKLQSVVASGNVRIDQGARWAVGGKATFEQTNQTLVLTENPVLHDGPNEVAGDRVIVYLDRDTAVVEGGRNKRVKGFFVPGSQGKPGATGQARAADAKPAAAASR